MTKKQIIIYKLGTQFAYANPADRGKIDLIEFAPRAVKLCDCPRGEGHLHKHIKVV